jgi:predicted dehydrogenase
VIAPALRLWSDRTIDGYEAGRWHSVGPLPLAAERRHFFEEFSAAVLDQGEPPVRPEQAAQVQAMIEAAYRAAETGRTSSVSQLESEARLPGK